MTESPELTITLVDVPVHFLAAILVELDERVCATMGSHIVCGHDACKAFYWLEDQLFKQEQRS